MRAPPQQQPPWRARERRKENLRPHQPAAWPEPGLAGAPAVHGSPNSAEPSPAVRDPTPFFTPVATLQVFGTAPALQGPWSPSTAAILDPASSPLRGASRFRPASPDPQPPGSCRAAGPPQHSTQEAGHAPPTCRSEGHGSRQTSSPGRPPGSPEEARITSNSSSRGVRCPRAPSSHRGVRSSSADAAAAGRSEGASESCPEPGCSRASWQDNDSCVHQEAPSPAASDAGTGKRQGGCRAPSPAASPGTCPRSQLLPQALPTGLKRILRCRAQLSSC